ncbi:MAG: hypothetical protein JWM11_6624 [Planctomycetaceae bacterium]|nr:hypothetical protein [Planctomycetaceae bacterium]
MSLATTVTVAEYLEFERNSELRHEFFQGEMREMTGGTLEHIIVIMNLGYALQNQLPESDFLVVTNEMRVKVNLSGLYAYPDVIIVKGQAELEDESRDTLLNPIVLMEVLSDSTEKYDRGEKFSLYQGIPSFQEYVLVAQNRPEIDQFVRDKSGTWQRHVYRSLSDNLKLQSVPCSIPLTTIYKKIRFAAETS